MRKDVTKKIGMKEFDQVFNHIHVPKDPPYMVLIAGPCRVGTTALCNALARTGITSYMQPIKSIRRAIESGEAIVDWEISSKDEIVASKETFGSRTESEFFDPVKILLDAGYPRDRISLVAIMREPERTLTSWTWMWEEVLMSRFIRAYIDTLEMVRCAEDKGTFTTCYVHEAIRDNDALLIVNNILSRVLPFERDVSQKSVDWSSGENFDNSASVRFFDKPPERFVHAIKTWGGYQYRELIPDLTYDQKEALSKNGVYQIYDVFRERCQRELGIRISRNTAAIEDADLETKDMNS
jgi:hypothetical protein